MASFPSTKTAEGCSDRAIAEACNARVLSCWQATLAGSRKGATSAASALASGLRKLAADIEERPDLVDAAADDMAQVQFMPCQICDA